MTEFVVISDTHAGAMSMGYYQQPGYPQALAAIMDSLSRWIDNHNGVEFVLHAGDLVDIATPATISLARDLLDRLPVPTYLCLGNHDLTTPAALELWQHHAPGLLGQAGQPDFTIVTEDVAVCVAPTQWCDQPYYWREELDAQLTFDQWRDIDACLAAHRDRPGILVTHSAVWGLPPEQTGLAGDIHGANGDFCREIAALGERHPNLVAVFGGHTHMNMHRQIDGVHYVTASALTETPFEFKHVRVDREWMNMTTHSLTGALALPAKYDATRTYVQGRGIDRGFSDLHVNDRLART
jgi:3',5'-cyclic AMP phosphodiesterase CpdA